MTTVTEAYDANYATHMKFPDGVLGCRFAYQMGGLTHHRHRRSDVRLLPEHALSERGAGGFKGGGESPPPRHLRIEGPSGEGRPLPSVRYSSGHQWGETSCLTAATRLLLKPRDRHGVAFTPCPYSVSFAAAVQLFHSGAQIVSADQSLRIVFAVRRDVTSATQTSTISLYNLKPGNAVFDR